MMRNFFRRICLIWDDLDADDKFDFVQVIIVILLCIASIAAIGNVAIRYLDDPNPKPPGKTIYLQPY